MQGKRFVKLFLFRSYAFTEMLFRNGIQYHCVSSVNTALTSCRKQYLFSQWVFVAVTILLSFLICSSLELSSSIKIFKTLYICSNFFCRVFKKQKLKRKKFFFTRWLVWGAKDSTRDLGKIAKFLHPHCLRLHKVNFFPSQQGLSVPITCDCPTPLKLYSFLRRFIGPHHHLKFWGQKQPLG